MPRHKNKARNGKTVGAQPTSRQPSKLSARPTHEVIPTMSVGKKKTPREQKPSHSGETFHFLDLPLEIRVMIYTHVLSTKNKDGKTNIYKIEEHGDRNNFQLKNFGWNHTALLAVNRQVREEVQTCCDLEMAFKFRSTMALRQFVYDGEYYYPELSELKINMLHAATKVEVMVGGKEQSKWTKYRPVQPLRDVAHRLSMTLTVDFIAKRSINQAFNKRCRRLFNGVFDAWKDWMEHATWLDRSPRVA
jgi:hypothetical protein